MTLEHQGLLPPLILCQALWREVGLGDERCKVLPLRAHLALVMCEVETPVSMTRQDSSSISPHQSLVCTYALGVRF